MESNFMQKIRKLSLGASISNIKYPIPTLKEGRNTASDIPFET